MSILVKYTRSDQTVLFVTLIILLAISACVEPFSFDTENERPAIAIEGYISDISSMEYEKAFGEPRLFFLKLRNVSSVKNYVDEGISGAEIELISDQGESWDYTEDAEEQGTYYLFYPSFTSQPNVGYKIQVILPNGEEYESDFDQMPTHDVRGEISEEEVIKPQNVTSHDGSVIREIKGLDVNIQMPAFKNDDIRYYRWDFHVIWKLRAELQPPSHQQGECWIDEKFDLDENVLVSQIYKPAKVNLFFLMTRGNQKTKFGYAVRIRQQAMSQQYHMFWNDIHKQQSQSELFAPPPYNIYSNLQAVGNDKQVYGFFGVVNEEYYTWFYDRYALSYDPGYIEECFVAFPMQPQSWCSNCMSWDGIKKGSGITDTEPIWWED